MAACHTAKQTAVPTPTVTLNDSVTERMVIKTVAEIDTVTVYVEIPAQTVERVVNDTTSHVETDFAESDAWISADGTLGHSIRNKPHKIPAEVLVPTTTTSTVAEAQRIKEVAVRVPEPYPVEKTLSRWQQIRLDLFWYLVAGLLAALAVIGRQFFRA